MHPVALHRATRQAHRLPAACRFVSQRPPSPRPFEERRSRIVQDEAPEPTTELPPAPKKGLLSRWLGSKEQKPLLDSPPDPERGVEASYRVVKEGVLDSRYKEGEKKWTRLIVALPVAIYLSYELFRRRFQGVEQKQIGVPPKDDLRRVADVERHYEE